MTSFYSSGEDEDEPPPLTNVEKQQEVSDSYRVIREVEEYARMEQSVSLVDQQISTNERVEVETSQDVRNSSSKTNPIESEADDQISNLELVNTTKDEQSSKSEKVDGVEDRISIVEQIDTSNDQSIKTEEIYTLVNDKSSNVEQTRSSLEENPGGNVVDTPVDDKLSNMEAVGGVGIPIDGQIPYDIADTSVNDQLPNMDVVYTPVDNQLSNIEAVGIPLDDQISNIKTIKMSVDGQEAVKIPVDDQISNVATVDTLVDDQMEAVDTLVDAQISKAVDANSLADKQVSNVQSVQSADPNPNTHIPLVNEQMEAVDTGVGGDKRDNFIEEQVVTYTPNLNDQLMEIVDNRASEKDLPVTPSQWTELNSTKEAKVESDISPLNNVCEGNCPPVKIILGEPETQQLKAAGFHIFDIGKQLLNEINVLENLLRKFGLVVSNENDTRNSSDEVKRDDRNEMNKASKSNSLPVDATFEAFSNSQFMNSVLEPEPTNMLIRNEEETMTKQESRTGPELMEKRESRDAGEKMTRRESTNRDEPGKMRKQESINEQEKVTGENSNEKNDAFGLGIELPVLGAEDVKPSQVSHHNDQYEKTSAELLKRLTELETKIEGMHSRLELCDKQVKEVYNGLRGAVVKMTEETLALRDHVGNDSKQNAEFKSWIEEKVFCFEQQILKLAKIIWEVKCETRAQMHFGRAD